MVRVLVLKSEACEIVRGMRGGRDREGGMKFESEVVLATGL